MAWGDYAYNLRDAPPSRPLGHLAYLVASGAKVVEARRVLPGGSSVADAVSFKAREPTTLASISHTSDSGTSGGARGGSAGTAASLRERLEGRVAAEYRGSMTATRLVENMLSVAEVFDPLDVSKCTQVIEFKLTGVPKEVSFKVAPNRKCGLAEYKERLDLWESRGITGRVPWDTPAYGFAIMVPKPGGKWRLTINPTEVNRVTEKFTLDGGFMPDNMILEAQRVGRRKIACKFDAAEAFLTMSLGAEAQRLSTFTTPIGKYRWKQGYFGWHSFPAHFQKLMMTRVVLPVMDHYDVTILCWVDDLIVAADDADILMQACVECMRRLLEFGGRINLDKSELLVTRFDFCGVEADLPTNKWRIAPGRVSSLMETPPPEDRVALSHVLGLIRYYFFGVRDHNSQRLRMAKLLELEQSGTNVLKKWTAEHNTAMYDALREITNGDWLLVYNPMQPVTVTTDASGSHGFCITACQYDIVSGEIRPISYMSRGWVAGQVKWQPQVKEMYAAREAICSVMPKNFPYADVVLLCDNKNLSYNVKSKDLRVVRWQQDITDAGCVTRYWIPGEWNTISDYGSRSVLPKPDGALSAEDAHEMHIYAGVLVDSCAAEALGATPAGAESLSSSALGSKLPSTVVPGHYAMAPMVETIVRAQKAAPAAERATWKGADYSEAVLGGEVLTMYKSRLLVPDGAQDIKTTLMRTAHDNNAHYMGAQRTIIHLQTQARVHWKNMHEEVQKYVNSCFRCQIAKANSHGKAWSGSLSPTLSPCVHHTWYVDMKGPFPHGTGYLLSCVEAASRMVKLRYVASTKATDVRDALNDIIEDYGTRPYVLRTDGGQPFDSWVLDKFCKDEGINKVVGIPYHSQGQGLVETRFRSIAGAIMATLGAKAPHLWFAGRMLRVLENLINSTFVESIHGSPYWAMNGREPRTKLAASLDWTVPNWGETVLEMPGAEFQDYMEIVAQHHATLNAVHERVLLASSVAQAITKRTWDASREPPKIVKGMHVLLLHTAPNRMLPHFKGPYLVQSVSDDGNFIDATHYSEKSAKVSSVHVSRVLEFDASRTSKDDLEEFYSYKVESVLDRRWLDNGSIELLVKWHGSAVSTWEAHEHVKASPIVRAYMYGVHGAIKLEYEAARIKALAARLPPVPQPTAEALPLVVPAVSLPVVAAASDTRIAGAGAEASSSTVAVRMASRGRGAGRGGGRGAADIAHSTRTHAEMITASSNTAVIGNRNRLASSGRARGRGRGRGKP